MNEDLSAYFSGEQLYGDDFAIEQIREWYTDEVEGYANLGAKEKDSYFYKYHRLNIAHGYQYIGQEKGATSHPD